MVYNYWKPVLISVLFSAIIYVDGRPSENNVENVNPDDKSDSVQILEFNSLNNVVEDAGKNVILQKLFYKLNESGLNVIPIRLIYDTHSPANQPFPKSYADRSSYESTNDVNSVSFENANANAITTRRERNSKLRNISDIETIKETLKKQYFQNAVDYAKELLATELKSFNDTKNRPLTVAGFDTRVNNTRKKIPVIFHLFPPPSKTSGANATVTTDEQNATKIGNVAHKYIVPILDKLQELNNNNDSPGTESNDVTSQTGPTLHTSANSNSVQVLNPEFEPESSPTQQYDPLTIDAGPFSSVPQYPYPHNPLNDMSPYVPNGPAYHPFANIPPYYNYAPPPQSNIYGTRQWASPFGNYFPVIIRDPFQSAFNYFSDVFEYGPEADVCRRPFRREESANVPPYPPYLPAPNENLVPVRVHRSTNENDDEATDNEPEPSFESGKRRYDDDDPEIEYVEHRFRRKRNAKPQKDNGKIYAREIKKKLVASPPETWKVARAEYANTQHTQVPDFGPQIKRLVVRRGGVAIAGPGGIATAGSGGTAIVGPGGTAFTTPASSGGVAMVGPGGKVVKVPDLTSVLYGRTDTKVTATGAGHTTFTNKNGEAFTTSDNTGGVALVSPDGEIFGVQDVANIGSGHKTETKEVQLPPGARLLTTGPIIYYNPVYPMMTNQLLR